MFVLSSRITIGNYVFNQIVEVEIDSSYENFSDTCTITIPRRLSFKDKSIIVGQEPIFKKGDQVTVQLGYGFENKKTVFNGYLLRVESGTPIKLICEDGSYLLKQTQPFNLSYKSLTVQQLLKDIIPSSIPTQSPDIQLGKARFVKMTASQILHFLRNKFGIKSWFRNGTLYCGLNYFPSIQNTYPFEFQKNIISDNLQFVRAADTLISVNAISILPNNKRVEVVVGDPDGAVRTFHYYGITDSSKLKERANNELQNLKFDGFTGTFTTFGLFNIQHGDKIKLTDNYFPEKNGTYICKSVKTKFGAEGYRVTVELAQKV